MKQIYLLLLVTFYANALFAQDLIYTLKGEVDGETISIDSIYIENLTNSTSVIFTDLPARDDYRINMTQNEFMGSTSISLFDEKSEFSILKNIPGTIEIACNKVFLENISVVVYNINGQILHTAERRTGIANTIQISLGGSQIYMVRIETDGIAKTVKAVGSALQNNIDIKFQGSRMQSLKRGLVTTVDNFSYNIGDSIEITVFKEGYAPSTAWLEITEENQSLTFSFADYETGTFTDSRDGKKYMAVKIGGMWLMAENMAYNPSITKSANNSMAWTFGPYDNNEDYVAEYGYLYNFNTAKQSVPRGWRMSTKADWENILSELENILRNEGKEECYFNTNGINIKCGGFGSYDGVDDEGFGGMGDETKFWIPVFFGDEVDAIQWEIDNDECIEYNWSSLFPENGAYVRCVKN